MEHKIRHIKSSYVYGYFVRIKDTMAKKPWIGLFMAGSTFDFFFLSLTKSVLCEHLLQMAVVHLLSQEMFNFMNCLLVKRSYFSYLQKYCLSRDIIEFYSNKWFKGGGRRHLILAWQHPQILTVNYLEECGTLTDCLLPLDLEMAWWRISGRLQHWSVDLRLLNTVLLVC